MWSVGNEEWGVEWDEKGRRIVSELRDVCHRLDPTRPYDRGYKRRPDADNSGPMWRATTT